MKSKSKSIIVSLFIVVAILIFSTLSVVSMAIPNLAKEIKKDLNKGVQSLCVGDINQYYNMYNTRKLTEIEKTKFYEKITETQNVVTSEMDLFKKYKLTIKINDVSIIDKIGDNLFLCNINVNYKYRKNHNTTDTVDKTEDYIIKIIDVGDMEYKILLPFNSLDKDFSSSNLYNKLKESEAKKQADKIQKEREEQEKTGNESPVQENDDIENDNTEIEPETDNTNTDTNNEVAENNTTQDTVEETVTTEVPTINNNDNNSNNGNDTIKDDNKSSFESFLED